MGQRMEKWAILWPDGSLLLVYGPQEIELHISVAYEYPRHADEIEDYGDTVVLGGAGRQARVFRLRDGRTAVALLLSYEEE